MMGQEKGTVELTEGVHWVGAKDPDLTIFDIVVPTEFGTTYNSYLILDEKPALIDTVKKPFEEEFLGKLRSLIDPKEIKYIVINHTEPDHSGALPRMVEEAPDATLVYSKNARIFVKNIINREVPSIEVGDGDSIELGRRRLEFISAPFLHWPDTIFTYLPGERILFTCDALGAHFCDESLYNDECPRREEAYGAFKYYYNCIMRPFSSHIIKAMDKIKDLPLRLIATSHGHILRSDLKSYIDYYRERAGRVEELATSKRAAIIYTSSYGNTARMAQAVAQGVEGGGAEPTLMDAAALPLSHLVDEIEISNAVLFGSPTLNGKVPKPILDLISNLVVLDVRGKLSGVFGSYGWSGEALTILEGVLKALRFELVGKGVRVALVPSEGDLKRCEELGASVAAALAEKLSAKK